MAENNENKIRRRKVSSTNLKNTNNNRNTIKNSNNTKNKSKNSRNNKKKSSVQDIKRKQEEKEQFELEREIYYRKKKIKRKKRLKLITKISFFMFNLTCNWWDMFFCICNICNTRSAKGYKRIN